MAQSSLTKQTHFGRDVQRTETDANKTASTSRQGTQQGSSNNTDSSIDNRNRQTNQSRQSVVSRSGTKSTATRQRSETQTIVKTPAIEGRNVSYEDVAVNFSLSIPIELGNITDFLSLQT